MPSPFPGMDPYLEGPDHWPDVHLRLIAEISNELALQVAPAYYVAVKRRIYVAEDEHRGLWSRPDVAVISADDAPVTGGGVAVADAIDTHTVTLPVFDEIEENYLEIRDTRTHEVVTVIEILSPSNKAPGEGRREYELKRRHVLRTLTNLVEIDLLRAGEPMDMSPRPTGDYRILVREGWRPARGRLHTFSVRQPIPEFQVPLREREPQPTVHLGLLLNSVYDRARYDLRLDYREQPNPPLTAEDASWAEELLGAPEART